MASRGKEQSDSDNDVKSLRGEWLGSGVGNKDRYGEILTAGSSAGFSQWEHRLPQARMQD